MTKKEIEEYKNSGIDVLDCSQIIVGGETLTSKDGIIFTNTDPKGKYKEVTMKHGFPSKILVVNGTPKIEISIQN